MRTLLALVLLAATPAWGQFGFNVPLRTNTGGPGCPQPATGPQPSSIRGSTINSAVAICVTTSLPASAVAGDFAVLFFSSGDAAGLIPPSGWTQIYQTPTEETTWNILAAYKTLSSGDISTGSVQACSPNSVSFDVHLGITVFVGGTGSVREYEGNYASSAQSITNTTTSGVLSTDVGLYWASDRQDSVPGPTQPVITPGSGFAASLHSVLSADACSLMAAQQMPGGVLAVVNSFGSGTGNGTAAVQVIVENP
jgi:hypothetical protein